jgi:quercetin dioxygenase-like cupin family protein
MIIRNYEDVEAVELMEGVKKRVVIGDKEGAPNFIMRIFELQPGASSPFHIHPWEHEVFILKGVAAVKGNTDDEAQVKEGDTIFIPPDEKHSLINKGKGIFRFMCLIPTGVDETRAQNV